MTEKHAQFSPSAAHRWIACSGSWAAEQGKKSEGSEASREGSLAHAFAEWCLSNNTDPMEIVGIPIDLAGYAEKQFLSQDMAEHLLKYVSFCKSISANASDTIVEGRFKIPGHISFWGTADFVCYESFGTLHVVDLKYGFNEVRAEDNPQLAAYALGVLNHLEEIGVVVTEVQIHVFQPRTSGPAVDSWIVEESPEEFAAQWTKRFEDAIVECLISDNPPRVSGDHCLYCLDRLECPKVKDDLMVAAVDQFSDDPTKEEIEEIAKRAPIDELVRIVSHEKVIKSFLAAAHKKLTESALQGETIQGFKLVNAYGNRQWAHDEKTMVKKLRGQKLKQDQYFEKKLKSPSKLEKILDKDWVSKHITRADKGPVLVPEKDKRPAIDVQSAEKQFED